MRQYQIELPPSDRTLYVFLGEFDGEEITKATGASLNINPSEWYGCFATKIVK